MALAKVMALVAVLETLAACSALPVTVTVEPDMPVAKAFAVFDTEVELLGVPTPEFVA